MTQDEILAAKAAALATAKSELETAAGFRAPLAPGLRPPQYKQVSAYFLFFLIISLTHIGSHVPFFTREEIGISSYLFFRPSSFPMTHGLL